MLMTMQQFADYIGVSYQTVREGCLADRIPYYLVGKHKRMIDSVEALEAMKGQPQKKEVKPVTRCSRKKASASGESAYRQKISEMIKAVCTEVRA